MDKCSPRNRRPRNLIVKMIKIRTLVKVVSLFCGISVIVSCQLDSVSGRTDQIAEEDSDKVVIQQVEPILDTLINTTEYLILGVKNDTSEIKIVDSNEILGFPTFEILAEYGEDVIIGKNFNYGNLRICSRYNPKFSFDGFKVNVYTGKLSNPDFSTNPGAKRFITRIKSACEKGVNFAGHYTLAIWGCGSGCQSGVVVDRKTGEIYDGYGTSWGSKFKIDSQLIVRNIGALDTATNLIEYCAYCNVNTEIWTGKEFKDIKI